MTARAAILLLVCAAIGYFLHREAERGSFDEVDRAVLNWLQHIVGRETPAANVVLIELRDRDLDSARRTFDTWPPGPLDYALLFEALFRLKPAAVAVEPVLAWPLLSPLDSSTLAERVTLLPRGVLACVLTKVPLVSGDSDTPPLLPQLTRLKGDVAMVPEFAGMLVGPLEELRGMKPIAFSQIDPDSGVLQIGTSISLPMLARKENYVVPSLVMQTLLSLTGTRPDQVNVTLGEEIEITSSLQVRINRTGAYVFDPKFAVPMRRLDASNLLLDPAADEPLMRHEKGSIEALHGIANAVVVLGDTSSAAQIATRRGRISLPELMAQALAGIQTGSNVRQIDRRITWGICLVIALCGLAQLRLTKLWIGGVTLALLLTLATATVLAFHVAQLFIPPIEIISVSTAATLVALLLGGSEANRERLPETAPVDTEVAAKSDPDAIKRRACR
ncbi:MAG: hypothetical protein ACR2OZ_08480 [Verrucomicrobiales bacterium]